MKAQQPLLIIDVMNIQEDIVSFTDWIAERPCLEQDEMNKKYCY